MSSTSQQRPIAEGIFTWPAAQPCLIGGRSRETGRIVFPMPVGNEATRYDEVALARRGHLWSWTVQRFLPKSPPYAGPETPETFRPYALGYVELPGEVIVETRLVDVDPETLRIGQPMELAIVPFKTTPEGVEVLTYAFRPAA